MAETNRQARKEKQAEFVREQFIEAAWEIINELGVRALTIDEVAKRAGYAPGSVYNYFSGKDDLLVNVVTRDSERRLAMLRIEIPEGLSPEQGLTWWVRSLLCDTEGRRSVMLDLVQGLPVESPEVHRRLHEMLGQFFPQVVKVISERLAKLLPDASEPPYESAWLLLGLLQEQVMRWMLESQPGQRLTDRAEQIVRVFLYGVLGRSDAASRQQGGRP